MEKQPEVWLRGPLPDIHPLLQPVAHALLQAVEHVQEYTRDFPDELLWVKPAGTASAGFHLQHLRGVPERLFSYAMGGKLSESQLADLRKEGIPDESLSTRALADAFARQVGLCVDQLKSVDPDTLTDSGVWEGKNCLQPYWDYCFTPRSMYSAMWDNCTSQSGWQGKKWVRLTFEK